MLKHASKHSLGPDESFKKKPSLVQTYVGCTSRNWFNVAGFACHALGVVELHPQLWSQAAGALCRRDFWLIVC